MMLLLELVGGQVAEAAVWPDGVVVDAPGLDEDGPFDFRRFFKREFFR